MYCLSFCAEISGGQYQLPKYDRLSNSLLTKMFDQVKSKIRKEIDTFDVCGLTTDRWTSRQCLGYMSLTIHYVTKAFKLVTRTLAIKNITGSQNGETIKNKIKQLLNEWGLSQKAECITTDNGKN